MPQNHKITKRIFLGILEECKNFLEIDHEMDLHEDETLPALKKRYESITSESQDSLATLAIIEEIIIQLRCKQVINSLLRLSLNGEYIYARSLFYRRGSKINDIRVLICKTEDIPHPRPTDYDDLLYIDTFREECITKLLMAMDKEIEKNKNLL